MAEKLLEHFLSNNGLLKKRKKRNSDGDLR
jgi:hypothetical protein